MIQVKKIIRGVKEGVLDYDDVQKRIRAATSNDPVGPDERLLARIAHDTRNRASYNSMFAVFWKRLTDLEQPSHMLKALLVAEYLAVHGDARFVRDLRVRADTLKRLTGYKFYRNHSDVGSEIRERARELRKLLASDDRLDSKRAESNAIAIKQSQRRYQRSYESSDAAAAGRLEPRLERLEYLPEHSRSSLSSPSPSPSPSPFREVSSKVKKHKKHTDSDRRRHKTTATTTKAKAKAKAADSRIPAPKTAGKQRRSKPRPTMSDDDDDDDDDDDGVVGSGDDDVSVEDVRWTMATLDAFAPTANSAEPVDLLTGSGSATMMTTTKTKTNGDWISEMALPTTTTTATRDMANTGLMPQPQQQQQQQHEDGYEFDDALVIDSDDDINNNNNNNIVVGGGGSFWDMNGAAALVDVSDLSANEFTKPKAKPRAKQPLGGAMTLQQIAAHNALKEKNALTIRPMESSASPPPPGPSAAAFHHHHHQHLLQQQQQQQQYAAVGYATPLYALQPYTMTTQQQQIQQQQIQQQQRQQQPVMDPFASFGKNGPNNMWNM